MEAMILTGFIMPISQLSHPDSFELFIHELPHEDYSSTESISMQ